jgi:2-oxoglutarate dehydrogenase complex dehydrogenase (E1) component-like enzyme
MRLAQPTTAAQYFHLLRSQARGAGGQPLIVFTPKSLLRARPSRSPLIELTVGGFQTVVDDPATSGGPPLEWAGDVVVDPTAVQRVLLCSGKVAFDLMNRRQQLLAATAGLPVPGVGADAVAVVRLEQLYPWPEAALDTVLRRYPSARQVIWVQEEPENMGAWSFAHGRLHRLLRDRFTLTHVSRSESASPATGSAALHHLELEDLLARAFA